MDAFLKHGPGRPPGSGHVETRGRPPNPPSPPPEPGVLVPPSARGVDESRLALASGDEEGEGEEGDLKVKLKRTNWGVGEGLKKMTQAVHDWDNGTGHGDLCSPHSFS